jgi:hypothetical protein
LELLSAIRRSWFDWLKDRQCGGLNGNSLTNSRTETLARSGAHLEASDSPHLALADQTVKLVLFLLDFVDLVRLYPGGLDYIYLDDDSSAPVWGVGLTLRWRCSRD